MSESVIVAIISGGLSALAAIASNAIAQQRTTALFEYRLKRVEEKCAEMYTAVNRMELKLARMEERERGSD